MSTYSFISPLASFLLTLLLIPVLRNVALAVGLVDKPDKRKVHQAPVPLVGGIGIFMATILALSMSLPLDTDIVSHKNVFVAVLILLLMGVIDDRLDLSASLKLAIQLILAHYVYSQGIRIESLHGLFGINTLDNWMQYGLSVLVITGAVNAFNLMDGIDGLAAGLALAGFAVFSFLGLITGNYTLVLIFLTFIGALLAFLRFNLSKSRKVFMGDAGSLALGFVLVVSGIKLIQSAEGSTNVSMVVLGVIAVLLVPVFDALRVFRKRIKSGKSPFSPDKTHLHHLVLAAGLKHKTATLGIITIMAGATVLGFLVFRESGVTAAIVLMLLSFYSITGLLQFNDKLNHWKGSIQGMEKRYQGFL